MRQGPAHLRLLRLRDLLAGCGRVEVVAAAVGVERAEQAVRRDHLAQRAKRRSGAFLLDQQHRVNLAGRVVERHDQVDRRAAFDPCVTRAVLMQHHAPQRTPRPLLAVGAALLRPLHQTGRMQRELGHRVTELVVVPLHQLLVEVLDREIGVLVPVQPEHPLEFLLRRPLAARGVPAADRQAPPRPPPRSAPPSAGTCAHAPLASRPPPPV